MTHRVLVAIVVPLAWTLVGACGGGANSVPGTFTVDFPTAAAAIAVMTKTPGVQVSVYATDALGAEAGATSGLCETLVEESLANGTVMAPAVATSAVVTACELMAGKGSLAMPYGSYAFLAVAQSSQGQDLLVGCAEQTISSTNTNVLIPMTLASSTMALPTSKCTMLSQACGGGGGC
jgi:hypothetical protein